MSTREHIGELIRERRLARGFSLGQLATKLGKTPAVVRAWERGEDTPDEELTAALVEALDLDASELDGLVATPEIEPASPGEAAAPEADAVADATPATSEVDAIEDDDAVPVTEAVVEVTDATATAPSVAADQEPLHDVEEPATIEGAAPEPPQAAPDPSGETKLADAEPEAADGEPEVPTSDPIIEHAAVIPAVGPAADEPTEAMSAPVATIAPPEREPGGYDVIDPVVAETPARPPITVPPLRLPNPIRLLFDPHHRYLYWIRYALTIVVLFILVRMFVWAGGELWTALGDFLDTFRATDSEEEQALRFFVGV